MLHENNYGDGVENCRFAFHVQTRIRFTQPNQALEHADRFPVLTNLRTLPQELIVGVKYQLSLLGYHWLKHFLDEVYVLSQRGLTPRLLTHGRLDQGVELGARPSQDVLGTLRVLSRIMVVDKDEDKIEST